MIAHYPGCNANYPEKPEGEPARDTQVIGFDDDDEEAHICVDCGAFEVKKKES